MKSKLISIGAVVLVLSLLLTALACGKGGESGGTTPTPSGNTPTPKTTPTPAPQTKTLKIGFLGPLSGPAAPWGVGSEVGTKWAADTINAAGGIKVGSDTYMIKVVSWDDKYTGSVAATAATEIAAEGIHYVIGPIGTFDAIDPIFEQNKVLYIVQGTVGQPKPEMPYRVNGITKSYYWTDAFYKMWTKYHPEIKTVAVVSPNDQLGYEFLPDTQQIAPKYGVTIVGTSYYDYVTDFYPVLTPLVAKNPDGFDLTGASPPGIAALLTKQLRELGFKGWIIQPAATDTSTLLEVAGPANVWKILSSYPGWSSPALPERTRALYQEWLTKYAAPGQTEMGITTSNAYKAVLFVRDAIEKAGSIDAEKVLNVLDDPSFRFDIFGAVDQQLGGVQEFGIRRQFPHEIPYGEIIDAANINLSMDMTIANVP